MTLRMLAFRGMFLTGQVCSWCSIGITLDDDTRCSTCEQLNGAALRKPWRAIEWAASGVLHRAGGEQRRFWNLEGKRFGKWTVLELAASGVLATATKWRCWCECGTVAIVNAQALVGGESTQCFRCGRKTLRTHQVGERLGTRVLVDRFGYGRFLWRCDCGRTAILDAYRAKRCLCRHNSRPPSHLGKKWSRAS